MENLLTLFAKSSLSRRGSSEVRGSLIQLILLSAAWVSYVSHSCHMLLLSVTFSGASDRNTRVLCHKRERS